jgi:predicted O-methyltransferase YrrM
MVLRTLLADEAIYRYVLEHSLREHPELAALRRATQSHPLAVMQISPEQGQFMALLVKLLGARRTIEIGVFTGYSALAVALALPEDGRLLACDIADADVKTGMAYWQRAGVASKIDVRIAPAAQTLRTCLDKGEAGQYDFVFIDADKSGYDEYYEYSLQLLRAGGLAMIDNTLRGGDVARRSSSADTRAIQALNDKIHADERVDMVLLPFSDGVTLARKR